MKKILISAYSLGLGGIEKALINLLQLMDKRKYDITLVLEKKEGIFLSKVPKEVKIVEYHVHNDKNVILRKIKNRVQLWKWKKEHKNQYDFAISFATYSRPGAHIALNASSHHALWIHNNYEQLYEKDEIKMKAFLESVQAWKFEHLVFVSYDNLESLCKYFEEFRERSMVCNNIIDYEKMYEESKEKIALKKEKITFLNVGRQEEHQKRLTRIIEAASKLKKEGFQFTVWFVGDGVDHEKYQSLVEEKKLEDMILFLGKKENPFPYYKKCDAVLLSSKYEGYPVVFIEAMTMNRPLITTKVSDYHEIEDGYGIVVENSEDGIYQGMKEYLERGYKIKKKFDPKTFNQEIMKKLDSLINQK